MKAMNELRKRKAVSPVIATVILVAVAITISVAVAYWMGGIATQYTKFEKVEVSSAVCTLDAVTNKWTIDLSLKNTGTAQATISDVFINDRKIDPVTTPEAAYTFTTGGASIASGGSSTVAITIERGVAGSVFGQLTSGTTVNIKFHSAGGMDYLKLIELV